MDIVDKEKRSLMMAKIKSKNTKPEIAVRRALHARGFRYRLHVRSLPGSPDISLPKYRVVIFVHGCFWHRHAGCSKAYMPKSNVDRWDRKFVANVERDASDIKLLNTAGWRVITIWECAVGGKQNHLAMDWLVNAITLSSEQRLEWPLPLTERIERS